MSLVWISKSVRDNYAIKPPGACSHENCYPPPETMARAMGSVALRGRVNWKDYCGANAAARVKFFQRFHVLCQGTEYRIRSKPRDFRHVMRGDFIRCHYSEIYSPLRHQKA